VLFTADLKTFSERLVTKVETSKVEVVVKEEGNVVQEVDILLETNIMKKKVKRELDDQEEQLLKIEEKVTKVVKRRRKV
jgi:N-glycosylase/DNA lyase